VNQKLDLEYKILHPFQSQRLGRAVMRIFAMSGTALDFLLLVNRPRNGMASPRPRLWNNGNMNILPFLRHNGSVPFRPATFCNFCLRHFRLPLLHVLEHFELLKPAVDLGLRLIELRPKPPRLVIPNFPAAFHPDLHFFPQGSIDFCFLEHIPTQDKAPYDAQHKRNKGYHPIVPFYLPPKRRAPLHPLQWKGALLGNWGGIHPASRAIPLLFNIDRYNFRC